MDAGQRQGGAAGTPAGAGDDDQAADRPDGGAGAGEFCAAGYAVGVGAARVHCVAGAVGVLVDPAPVAFPDAAVAASVVGHDDAGGGGVLDAPVAARGGDADDRRGRGGGVRAVRHLQDGRGVRSVGCTAGGAGGVGAGRGGADAGRRAAAAHGRRLTMRQAGVVAPGRAGIVAPGRAGVVAPGRAGVVALCWRVVVVAAILGVLGVPVPGQAQFGAIGGSSAAPARNDLPVTFSADTVEYDRDHNLVTATGHVEAWQNDHVMHADKVTIDRVTGVMAATGHVVLMEPDGEILFADYAEMNQGMKDGVLRDMQAILAQNGRLAANGARRTGGEINEISNVVYSTCNLCKSDPSKPPLWQLRANKAVQDLEHKKIEYEDAVLQMYGIPVAYFPYFWHVDPSVKRASGLLIPSVGVSSGLGAFISQPYYWVLDDQSDATFTPLLSTRHGLELDAEYRRRFNDGLLQTNVSAGYDENSPQGTVFSKGQFDYDDTWRWGFNLNRASSADYVRDFRLGPDLGGDINLLSSQIYLEGFGVGAYSRIDTKFYQATNTAITDSKLPVVLPRYQYSYFAEPDDWGGRLSLDAGAFNVWRSSGTDTRRANLTLNWERPFIGPLGDLWKLTLHNTAAAYDANSFEQQPNFGTHDQIDDA